MKKIFALICVVTAGYLLFSSGSAARASNGTSTAPSAAVETVDDNFAPVETRCGWFSNPTPANYWLDDKDASWTIGEQGGYQAEGDFYPVFGKGQWIKTNGSYGYGCACIKGTFNADKHQVVIAKSAVARPLASCRKDKALKKPNG